MRSQIDFTSLYSSVQLLFFASRMIEFGQLKLVFNNSQDHLQWQQRGIQLEWCLWRANLDMHNLVLLLVPKSQYLSNIGQILLSFSLSSVQEHISLLCSLTIPFSGQCSTLNMAYPSISFSAGWSVAKASTEFAGSSSKQISAPVSLPASFFSQALRPAGWQR